MTGPTIAGLSEDARDLLAALSDGRTRTQRDLAYALFGTRGGIRRVQAATQELRLAGWPIVSDGDGQRMENDPAVVRECAADLRRRAITILLTSRALRRTAEQMAEPLQLWTGAA